MARSRIVSHSSRLDAFIIHVERNKQLIAKKRYSLDKAKRLRLSIPDIEYCLETLTGFKELQSSIKTPEQAMRFYKVQLLTLDKLFRTLFRNKDAYLFKLALKTQRLCLRVARTIEKMKRFFRVLNERNEQTPIPISDGFTYPWLERAMQRMRI